MEKLVGEQYACVTTYISRNFLEPFFNWWFILFSYQFIVGDGNNVYDFTYVENVAHAHICADRALASEGTVSEKAAGEVPYYFFSHVIFLFVNER